MHSVPGTQNMTSETPELITRRGLIVPWVTRWTSEVRNPALQPSYNPGTGGLALDFLDEQPSDRIDGVLWMREGNSRGEGEPEWKQVSSHRQRACMLDQRCQVCGMKIEDTEIPWLLPASAMDRKTRTGLTTMTPPTCAACIPIAMRSCPQLGRTKVNAVTVTAYRPWAYFADYVRLEQGRQRHGQGEIPWNSADLSPIMARQVIVELYAYRRRRV
jgi:hypothetical protein